MSLPTWAASFRCEDLWKGCGIVGEGGEALEAGEGATDGP